MAAPDENRFEDDRSALREAAARWIVRRDRGLSEAERAEFERWRAADPRHAAAVARSETAWSMLGNLPGPAVVEFDPAPHRAPASVRWVAFGGLAAALAVLIAFVAARKPTDVSKLPSSAVPVASAPSATDARAVDPQLRILADGSEVRLNLGAEVSEAFTAGERRVRLVRGEAYFSVTRDAARPFIVEAGAIAVRAVGTAFNVSLQSHAVDVIVTEGTVQVGAPAAEIRDADGAPLVTAGYRAVAALAVPAAGPRIVVSATTTTEVSAALAWRDRLIKLGGATLAELARAFERQTGRKIVVRDAALAELRIGGRFRGDDLEGFVQVLESMHGVVSRRETDGTLVLSRAP